MFTKLMKTITSIIFIFLLTVSSEVKAATFTDNQTVNGNKKWTIKFNKEVLFDDSTKQNIKVIDSNNNVVSTTLSFGQNKKNVVVNAPTGIYQEGQRYRLIIGNKVNSKYKENLKQSTTLNFNIKNKVNNSNKKNIKGNEEKQTGLASQIANTKIAQRTNQIILVSGRELSLWNKSNRKWNKKLQTSDRLGYGGLTSNKHEGDGATPTGVYPILYGFGFGSNPGTSLKYKRITKNSYFVDDPYSKYYNQWYEGKGQKGEHMLDHAQYKYGMVIGYNTSHTRGKGSAIFLHCNGRGNTAGCVSVSEGNMLKLLREVHDGVYIIITSSNSNLKYY